MSRLSRRLFLGRGAAAAAAAPLLMAGTNQVGGPGAPLYSTPDPVGVAPYDDPVTAAARSLWGPEIRRVEARINKRSYYRAPTIDHWISALRSVTPQHKVAMQRRADDQGRTLLAELRRHIWPKYEDMEF